MITTDLIFFKNPSSTKIVAFMCNYYEDEQLWFCMFSNLLYRTH